MKIAKIVLLCHWNYGASWWTFRNKQKLFSA